MFDIRKVGDEWCAFHPSGREVARSPKKELLHDYINSLNAIDVAISVIVGGVSVPEGAGGVHTGSPGGDVGSRDVPPANTGSQGPQGAGGAALITKVSYKTRPRKTGATTATGRDANKQWWAVCFTHDASTKASSGWDAEKRAVNPETFCGDCARIVAGELPKVPRNKELEELL